MFILAETTNIDIRIILQILWPSFNPDGFQKPVRILFAKKCFEIIFPVIEYSLQAFAIPHPLLPTLRSALRIKGAAAL